MIGIGTLKVYSSSDTLIFQIVGFLNEIAFSGISHLCTKLNLLISPFKLLSFYSSYSIGLDVKFNGRKTNKVSINLTGLLNKSSEKNIR